MKVSKNEMKVSLHGECVEMKVSSFELCMKVMNLFKLRTIYKGDEVVLFCH